MSDFIEYISSITTSERIWDYTRAAIIAFTGYITAKITCTSLSKLFKTRLSTHQAMLLHQGSYYLIFGLFILTALNELGFNLGVLLGAAGIFTVAIGFASQTSASNLISGLFLLGEKPFKIGDIIKVADTVGEVLSIDLLSVKLRTFDNLFVRIPNETLIKSQVVTLTKFPIRRIDLQIGVAYKENIARVRDVLFEIADKNSLCLEEPTPLFIFTGFGESSLNIQFSVWAKRESFLDLRNSIYEEIKIAFDEHGIEIPFPHRTIYTGAETSPFPIKTVESKPSN